MDEDGWETLIPAAPPSKQTLGQYIIQEYLQKDGDVIEIDLTNQKRKSVGVLIKALNSAAKKSQTKAEFLLRYGQKKTKAYIKRVG